jgi:hypothetical protein
MYINEKQFQKIHQAYYYDPHSLPNKIKLRKIVIL